MSRSSLRGLTNQRFNGHVCHTTLEEDESGRVCVHVAGLRMKSQLGAISVKPENILTLAGARRTAGELCMRRDCVEEDALASLLGQWTVRDDVEDVVLTLSPELIDLTLGFLKLPQVRTRIE